jgi:hypothetical protein
MKVLEVIRLMVYSVLIASMRFFPVTIEPISKLIRSISGTVCVIPVQAGIHVFQGLKWTPAFARVRDFSES